MGDAEDYEDNFGYYDIGGDLEEFAFFCHVRDNSALTKCERCAHWVRLLPNRHVCATCAEWAELGGAKP